MREILEAAVTAIGDEDAGHQEVAEEPEEAPAPAIAPKKAVIVRARKPRPKR